MADGYILAARNKIASAKRHLAALNKLRAGDESERSQIQEPTEQPYGVASAPSAIPRVT